MWSVQDNEQVSVQETTGEGGDEGWTYRWRGGGKALPGALTQADLMIKTSINVDYTSFLQLQFTNFTSVLKPLRCIYILLGILGAFSWQFLCFYCTFTVFRSSPRVSSSSSSSCFQQTSSDKTSHMPPGPSFPSRFCITAVHEIVTAYKSTAFRCMDVNLKLFSTSASPPSFISFPSPGTTILLNSQFLPVYDIFTLLVIITCFFSLLHCHAWFSSVSDRQTEKWRRRRI